VIAVVIPAAGDGQRFKDAGYTDPKPLIPVLGAPMLDRVLENVTPKRHASHSIVIARHDLGYGDTLHLLDHPTAGALDTILQAAGLIDLAGGLLIANCDQLCALDVDDLIDRGDQHDGAVVTFPSSSPHHSYVETDENGIIVRIAEKEVISNQAVSGVYYLTRASDFLEIASDVVRRGLTTQGECYVSLAIAAMIDQAMALVAYPAETAILGTPEDMQRFEVAGNIARAL
jgi:NDP-sugar pyrophosphorylase family protein